MNSKKIILVSSADKVKDQQVFDLFKSKGHEIEVKSFEELNTDVDDACCVVSLDRDINVSIFFSIFIIFEHILMVKFA